ncbi:hypothetical protein, partial [Huaxiibacter chinensis]|uniref:hypothetical protein n=1 Tax=Huaxiibacter chinensis TaxID=2899785 RepID=UPI003F94D335
FQVVSVGPKAARHQAKRVRIGTVYRKVGSAAKAQRPALKFTELSPILNRICIAPDARFIHLLQQDSAYDQSITDPVYVATVF